MDNTSDIAFTILKFDEKYVFQHRDDKPSIASPGLYAGFGGRIEEGEEPLDAARRELSEETSLSTDSLELRLLGEVMVDGKEGVRYVYTASIDTDRFEVYEGQGTVSFTKQEISSMDLGQFADSTRAALESWVL